MPQGVVDRTTKLMSAPLAPKRESGSGHQGLDKVLGVTLAAKVWLKGQGLPFTVADLVALTGMALKAQQQIDDEAAKPKPSSPAPGHARRPAHPAKKDQP